MVRLFGHVIFRGCIHGRIQFFKVIIISLAIFINTPCYSIKELNLQKVFK